MNKISTIAMCAIFAFGMPLMASAQRSNIEHRPKKEMREKHRPRAMHDKDFKMMCEIVEDASFSKKKIGVVKVACISSYFNNEQCVKLLSMISFENDRMETLKVLAPRVLDPNPKEIQKQFSFSSSKEEVMEILYPERR